MTHIFTDFVKYNYRLNQSVFMTRFRTDLHHQYGIFGGKSQTSFSRNATRAGSEEGWLFLQANPKALAALLLGLVTLPPLSMHINLPVSNRGISKFNKTTRPSCRLSEKALLRISRDSLSLRCKFCKMSL